MVPLSAHLMPLLALSPRFFEAARSGIATLPPGTDLRVRFAREGYAVSELGKGRVSERIRYVLRARELFVGERS